MRGRRVGYFTLNPQIADLPVLPKRYQMIVLTSEMLKTMSKVVSPLVYAADSLYIDAQRS